MKIHSSVRTAAVSVALVTLVGACALVPAARPDATPVSGTPAAFNGSVSVTRQTPVAPGSTSASSQARPVSRQGNHPPAGVLGSGADETEGRLGSYCYGNTCADIGGWPAKSELPLLVVTTGKVRFALDNHETFVTWSAAYNDTANDDQATELDKGGHAFDPDSSSSPPPQFAEAMVDSPPAGDWVMWVWVGLEQGDLSYAWHVIVMPDTST